MPTPATQYVRYEDSVEVVQPDEEKVFDELAGTMRQIAETMNDRARHAARSVHAKSHALLKGELQVYGNLPEALQQGLFREVANYPVILRFSTNPGDILPDSISTPRGLAVKVVGIESAEMVEGHEGQHTQDFVFVNAKTFAAPNAAAFLKQVKILAKHATDPEGLKQAVSTVSRLFENALEAVGQESATLKSFGHPQTHILGETFCSQAALRYGNYIAKICIAPASDNLKALTGKHVDLHHQFSGLRDDMVEFFRTQSAEWEVKVQLCTGLETMPVEDPSVEWPEKESPYVAVARISVAAQNAYTPERRVYVDELLSFNPWHALAAHRPLGDVMRARRRAYPVSSNYRHQMNGRAMTEPTDISQLPD